MSSEFGNLQSCRFLNQLAVPYRVLCFSTEPPFGTATVAQRLKLEESSIVKTILFDAKDGSDLFMALVSGNATVKSSVLKKLVGSKNVTLASPERVSETTGYQIGSIPPFGWITSGFRVFIDKALLAVPEVGVGSGQWGVEILLSPSDLVRVTGAIPF